MKIFGLQIEALVAAWLGTMVIIILIAAIGEGYLHNKKRYLIRHMPCHNNRDYDCSSCSARDGCGEA